MTQPKMLIKFEGEGLVRAIRGETLLSASLRAGIPHYHACGGSGKCSTCRVIVLEGAEKLSTPSMRERSLIRSTDSPVNTRLACQAKILRAPLRVERLLKNEPRTSTYFELDYHRARFLASREALGSEKELVLFFLDIRNYTVLFRYALSYDVIHITRRLFDIFFNVVNKFEGRILETSGDQFYAVFGTTNRSGFVDQAIRCAFVILTEVEKFNNVYAAGYLKTRLGVGIGMHYGKVVVADINLGFEERMSVMGLPVIIAARIQSKTKTLNNSLLVSEEIVARCTVPLGEISRQTVKLKGIEAMQTVYLLGKPFPNPKKR